MSSQDFIYPCFSDSEAFLLWFFRSVDASSMEQSDSWESVQNLSNAFQYEGHEAPEYPGQDHHT